ncbi:amidohydrolase family protein [Shewanella sp. 202IG2-18]|uniref:amidohydrolase family protein n=1 Tax=Parashewanella hymeniacidonis TaxID=2807618 RepID=UPI00195FB5A8|nr:amidohydrolase family protein [Parashewanella hymeniacidonis]MBM7071752.1 amidohydrolase family protein [Parashewanella hymeniacidonis]
MINKSKVITTIAGATLVSANFAYASVPIVQPNNKLTAYTHATIYVAPNKQLKNATLLVQNNRVKAILKDNDVPTDAFAVDLTGYTIYPGFIDPISEYSINFKYPENKAKKPIYDIKRIGGNAENSAIHSEMEWYSVVEPETKKAKAWIKNGFTSVQSAKLDGIIQGRGVSISLSNNIANEIIYNARTNQFMSFNKGSSKQDYPASLMGSIALLRQTLSDANWYNANYSKSGTVSSPNNIEFNAALEKLNNLDKQKIIFETKNLNSQLRAARLLSEFELSSIQVATGKEYSRIDEVKALNYSLVVPLNFPKAPSVIDADAATEVSLADLRHWERAPSNPAALEKSDVQFAFTMKGIQNKDFWPQLKKAIDAGLSKEAALAALTTNAAEIAQIDDIAGQLKPGYMADFVITKGDIFEDGKIYSVFTQGQEHKFADRNKDQVVGEYQLQINQLDFSLEIEQAKKLKADLTIGEKQVPLKNVKFKSGRLTFTADLMDAGYAGTNRFVLWLDENELGGRMETASGEIVNVAAARTDDTTEPKAKGKEEAEATEYVSKLTHPNVGYGLAALPKSENLHIKNATIWTSEKDSVLENTDIIIADGKIDEIGQSLSTPRGYKVIDGSGKHVTAGIIDEHSHIAINGGVNEGTYSVTSEVRIGDVVNPDDVSIYRALAGGVTSAQLLHGSANPIGGQAQYIKMKWGETAENLKFDHAQASIKFALGENVKQTHWGDKYSRRFPKSRMGVDTLFRQTFDAAKEYQAEKAQYDDLRRSSKRKVVAPRTDYRLEAVSEILNDKRDIHIHSYIGSEILMFLEVAKAYDFKVKTFTHVLEGYKVAEELAEHGAGASTFSDWWAYKFEVYDAIPQNTCLMNNKGVVTSINSDDYSMQRRLNQEAAKSILYCDMSEADAWKMVTINPAIQLGVEKYVGSIKEGKMADLVLWSDKPLSVYAKAEKVWVEGTRYFDKEQDLKAQKDVAAERQALMQKILNSGQKAKQGVPFIPKKEPEWHCETVYHAWGEHSQHSH